MERRRAAIAGDRMARAGGPRKGRFERIDPRPCRQKIVLSAATTAATSSSPIVWRP